MSKYKTVEDMIEDRLWVPGKGMSAWDSASNYAGEDVSGWVIAISKTRDSDCLERCNFDALMESLGGEQENKVQIFGVNHWACGWVDQIQVHKDAKEQLNILLIALNKIDSYPVLNEDKLSEMEYEEANEVWKNCYNMKERIEYIKKYRDQFEFHNFEDMLSCCRGKYFSGYASELIYG